MSALFHAEGKLMKGLTWLANMVHIQILWIVFTLLGVVVGGLFPSTFSMFSVMRKLIIEKDTFSLNDAFWTEYKKDFIKKNGIGYAIFVLALLLNYYLRSAISIQNSLSQLYTILAIGFIFLFMAFLFWLGPVYAHFEGGIKKHSQFVFIFIFSYPFHTIGMFGIVFMLYLSIFRFPVLLPFVSIGIAVYFITSIALHAVKKSADKLQTK